MSTKCIRAEDVFWVVQVRQEEPIEVEIAVGPTEVEHCLIDGINSNCIGVESVTWSGVSTEHRPLYGRIIVLVPNRTLRIVFRVEPEPRTIKLKYTRICYADSDWEKKAASLYRILNCEESLERQASYLEGDALLFFMSVVAAREVRMKEIAQCITPLLCDPHLYTVISDFLW